MTKAVAEKKILDNLYCLLEGSHHSWTKFDVENCEHHGLDEKITEVFEGNNLNYNRKKIEFYVQYLWFLRILWTPL